MKAAPIRAELTNPMASPDARCAIAATESGKTGAMQSTCRKRSTPKLHTSPATPSAATSTEEPRRNQIMRAPVADDLGQARRRHRAERGGQPGDQEEEPAHLERGVPGHPERRENLREDRGEEEDLGGAGEHHAGTPSPARAATSAGRPRPAASRGLPGGTPQATRAEQAHSITPPRMKESRNPRRAATTAPTAGPSTCPSVMPDWM